MHSAKVLIVGGDGNIGRALSRSLRSEGIETVTTTRRAESDADGIFLDLSDLPGKLELPRVDAAVICAGIGSVGLCQSEPEHTRKVNVEAPIRLIREIASKGGRIVFLSTTHVFDGGRAFYSIGEPRNPITNYGRHKAEVERFIEENFPDKCAVARLTKVFSKGGGLPYSWANAWRAGEAIDAFGDMSLSPVSLEFAVGGLVKIIRERLTGTLHIAADEETSYFEFAKLLAARLGSSQRLVRANSRKSAFGFPMPERASLAPSFSEVVINGTKKNNKLSELMDEIAISLGKSLK